MPKTKPSVFDGQKITANEFFKTHWQRMPYLFTDTSLDLSCLPDATALFKLAAHEQVQSRIVYSKDQRRYQAIYDDPDAWPQVLNHKPTLLVSDIEKWAPDALRLMDWFGFVKHWRFDDLMMSYAPEGASVGAHTDHYDVFLVQVQGTRQWSYDTQPLAHANMVEDSELAVIDQYQPQLSHELKAGDVLYLPPEIPHHGVSTSADCITCSIGLRAPSNAELLSNIIELATTYMPDDLRFKDAVQSPVTDASIGAHEVNYLRHQLQQLSQLDDPDLARLFGQSITAYRLFDELPDTDQPGIEKSANNIWYKKSPFAVFTYYQHDQDKATLFVNGEAFETNLGLAQKLCDQTTVSRKHLNQVSPDSMNELRLIHVLLDEGALLQFNSEPK